MSDFKYYIALILFIGFVFQPISATRRSYEVDVEAFNFVKNPSYLLQIERLRLAKFNSTINVINANVTYTEDLPSNSMIHIKAYQLMASNKYSMIPVGPAPFHFCDAIAIDKQFYPVFRSFTNLPGKCPFKKGKYWLKEFVPRFNDLPGELPGERWRVDCEWKAGTKMIVSFQFWVYLNRNI